MTGSFARGAHTINSMFFKPMMRKSYHKKGSCGDNMIRETMKSDAEEVTTTSKSLVVDSSEGNNICWVPHDKTGIYYPKGQEKIMEDVFVGSASQDVASVWFYNNQDL